MRRGLVAQEGLWRVPHLVPATRPSDKLNKRSSTAPPHPVPIIATLAVPPPRPGLRDVVSLHSFHARARPRSFDASPHAVEDREEVDIADAECVLEDLVSKSRFIKITSEEFNAAHKEGGVSRIDKMGLRPQER